MYIDTHSHLNLEQFADDYDVVLTRMEQYGVRTQTIGVDVVSSARALQLSRMNQTLSRALVGIHPAYVELEHDYAADLAEIQSLLQDDMCVGIGECGFDYFRCDKSQIHDIQQSVFRAQIELSVEFGKPLMLHLRPTRNTHDAYDDALELLAGYRGETVGQAHFFAGTLAQARAFLELGFYISCTGVITFTRDYDELVRFVPVDRLLLETDAPYVAPVPYRGGRCEPWYVTEVYKRVAELRNISLEQLQHHMAENVLRLYRW